MKFKPLLVGLLLLIFFISPVMAGDGESSVKVVDKEGNVVDNAVKSSDSDNEKTATEETTEKGEDTDNTVTSDLDVWGLQDSGIDFTSYVNVGLLGGVYSSIIPLRNLSIVSVAVAFGLALISTIVGILLLVVVAGYGAAHPNTHKGWEYITGSRSKILGLGGVFLCGLFMIVLMFFFLYVFSQLDWFGM